MTLSKKVSDFPLAAHNFKAGHEADYLKAFGGIVKASEKVRGKADKTRRIGVSTSLFGPL